MNQKLWNSFYADVKMSNKSDLILEKILESGYKRPQTIQDIIDNRDILFDIISEIIDDKVKDDVM